MSKVYVNPDNENVLETLQPMRELQENPVGLLPRSEQNQISALRILNNQEITLSLI